MVCSSKEQRQKSRRLFPTEVPYGALTNVEYTITVTDTETGAVKTYFNPQGQLASRADTSAF